MRFHGSVALIFWLIVAVVGRDDVSTVAHCMPLWRTSRLDRGGESSAGSRDCEEIG